MTESQRILIRGGRLIDPASGRDETGDVAVAGGRILRLGQVPEGFAPERIIEAQGCWVVPGLVDLAARLREPGYGGDGFLESELRAAAAGGVTSLVCPPDTDPVLDEPGLVEMLKFRARKLSRCRLFPLGALTRQLQGEALTEMSSLTAAGCVGFSQAETALPDNLVLQRALQYAATFGFSVWLRPQDRALGQGVAASGAMATRLGLSGVPVAAETIALHTILELMRATGARVHLCRLSSAAGVDIVRQAKAEGLPLTADVNIHNLHLTDADIGYFNPSMRLTPPLRQQRDRAALRAGLADGTIDALVSDHMPVGSDEKNLPFAEATPGASALELLLGMALKWAQADGVPLARALAVVTHGPVAVLGGALGTLQASAGRLLEGGVADICMLDPQAEWPVEPERLVSQGKHTPFAFADSGTMVPGRIRATLVAGTVAFADSGLGA